MGNSTHVEASAWESCEVSVSIKVGKKDVSYRSAAEVTHFETSAWEAGQRSSTIKSCEKVCSYPRKGCSKHIEVWEGDYIHLTGCGAGYRNKGFGDKGGRKGSSRGSALGKRDRVGPRIGVGFGGIRS